MKKSIFLLSLFALSTTAFAQHFKTFSDEQSYLCPEGWEYSESSGDLNGDNVNDLVFVATPNDPEYIFTNEDGNVLNYNRPVLAIYFTTDDPAFRLWKEYDDILPMSDETTSTELDVQVTDRGTLVIEYSQFFMMGMWAQPSKKYVFRYQNGDFYCIGEESDSFSRNSGDGEKESFNYLTHKKSVTTYNAFDESVKERTTWSRIPKEPLKRLGDFEL